MLPLATIRRAIVAIYAGASPVGMVMVLAYKSAPGECHTLVDSGVGTFQEGEAMALWLCIRRLAH